MQERVPIVYVDKDGKKTPAGKPRKRKRRKGAAASTPKPKSDLPPRFRGTPVPFATRITWIRPEDIAPGLPSPFSGVANVECDLVVTAAGKRVPGVSNDEFAESGEVSLNEWLRILNGLRFTLRMEKRLVCRASGHQIGLVFERRGKRVAFEVRDSYTKAAVPGFEKLVLDRDALLAALREFVAETRRLVLKTAPSHAVADKWWHWHVYRSIDAPDDADEFWRDRD